MIASMQGVHCTSDAPFVIARLGEKSVTYQFTVDHAGRRIAEGKIVAVCCRLRHDEPLQAVASPARIMEQLRPYIGVET